MTALKRRAIIVLFLLFATVFFVFAMYGAVQGAAWLVGGTVDTFAFIVWAALVFPVMCWAVFQSFKNIW